MKDINYILEMIPHRYPFLLVDRIISKKQKKEIMREAAEAREEKNIYNPYDLGYIGLMSIWYASYFVEGCMI